MAPRPTVWDMAWAGNGLLNYKPSPGALCSSSPEMYNNGKETSGLWTVISTGPRTLLKEYNIPTIYCIEDLGPGKTWVFMAQSQPSETISHAADQWCGAEGVLLPSAWAMWVSTCLPVPTHICVHVHTSSPHNWLSPGSWKRPQGWRIRDGTWKLLWKYLL